MSPLFSTLCVLDTNLTQLGHHIHLTFQESQSEHYSKVSSKLGQRQQVSQGN